VTVTELLKIGVVWVTCPLIEILGTLSIFYIYTWKLHPQKHRAWLLVI